MINYNEWKINEALPNWMPRADSRFSHMYKEKLVLYKKLLLAIKAQGGVPDSYFTDRGLEAFGFPVKELLSAGVVERKKEGGFAIVDLGPSEVMWMMKR